MRVVLIFLVIVFLSSCKSKHTINESANELNTEEVRDSLETALVIISDRIDELAKVQERLLKSSDPANPIIKNLDKEYLKLLEERENIQIQIVNLKIH